MRCDKCHVKFIGSKCPSESWPEYIITEKTSILADGDSEINLCGHCSRRFYKWLMTKPEKELCEYEADIVRDPD